MKAGGAFSMWDRGAIEMIRGTIAECSAGRGGVALVTAASRLTLVDVLVTQCNATDKKGGGCFYMEDGNLTVSGGAIRDCEATLGSGGALKTIGDGVKVRLSGVTVQGCTAPEWGASIHINGGQLELVDFQMQDCLGEAVLYEESGTLLAERVRVIRCGRYDPITEITLTLAGISTWTDLTVADNYGQIWISSGTHTFKRTNILRSSALNVPKYGVLDISAGTVTMLDSRIADPGVGPWQVLPITQKDRIATPGCPCITAAGETTLILRSTVLSNCSGSVINMGPSAMYRSGTSISVTAAVAMRFQAELLTLEPSCDQDPSAALIGVDSTITEPLRVRGLRVVAPAACASQNFSVLSNYERLVNCSDSGKLCGTAATCTDVQLILDFKSASCSCQGEVFANSNGTSLALAPYGFDPYAIGLPKGVKPTDVGLPDSIIDYCVRAVSLNHNRRLEHA